MQRLAAQIEITMLEADFFWIVRLCEDRQRQLRCGAFNVQRLGRKLDFTSRQFRVHRFRVSRDHLAGNRQHAFGGRALGVFVEGCIRIHHNLRQAVMVAQIDEQGAGMLAAAVQPAREFDRGANIRLGEFAASMGAVSVHSLTPRILEA